MLFHEIRTYVIAQTVSRLLLPVFLVVSGCTAQSVVPQIRPAPVPLTPAQTRMERLHAAFAAADRGQWAEARHLAAGHPLAAEVIRWRALVDSRGRVDFSEATAFLRLHPDWPAIRKIQSRAEAAMPPDLTSSQVVHWFAGRPPVSARGKIRLGMAEAALGHHAEAARYLCAGWRVGRFSVAEEKQFAALPDISDACQRQRLDMLLWRRDTHRAERQMQHVGHQARALAEARIAVQRGYRSAWNKIQALPADLRKDPGLTYDRARAFRHRHKDEEAEEMLRRLPRSGSAAITDHAAAFWVERSIAARRALGDNRPRDAYRLVNAPGFSPDKNVVQYADDEFLAGWIALRKLHQPKAALTHFRNLSREVGRPISLARGAYWQGRALQALGRNGAAWEAYHRAAAYPETFYGQLGMMQSEWHPRIALQATPVREPAKAEFRQDDVIRVLNLLSDLDQPGAYRTFALQYFHAHTDGGHQLSLIKLAEKNGYPYIAVRLAKMASYDGKMFPQYAYPVIDVPPYTGPGQAPEKPLVMALIRQETEFNAHIVSPAGARGLMQIMPRSARRYAARAGLRYHPGRLLSDPVYNMRLGTTMVAEYWNSWGGQLILGAASYNAGPAAGERWIRANGDPRTDDVDSIDWIEQIPYHETRNYVQRVAENVEVYRFRIAGHPVPLRICQDIGMKVPTPLSPPVKPVKPVKPKPVKPRKSE